MAFSIDGQVHGNGSGDSLTVTLTTANADDVIVVDITTNGGPVTAVSSPTLGAFTKRAASGYPDMERWYAIASGALSAESITINCTVAGFTTVDAYGVSGADTSSPWQVSSVTGSSDPLSITPTGAGLVLGAFRLSSSSSTTAGTGLTLVNSGDYQTVEYEAVSSAGTVSVSLGSGYVGSSNGGVADVLNPASGGGGSTTTFAADAGAFSLTGEPVVFTQALTAAPGAFSLTGEPATLTQELAAAPGAFTLTGEPATFTQELAAAPGAFTLTGEPATFTQAIALQAGAFSLTGEAAIFAQELVAGAGVFSLAGQPASFTLEIEAGAGAFSITGQQATFSLGNVLTFSCEPGAFSLDGQAVLFTQSFLCEPGGFALIGGAASFSLGWQAVWEPPAVTWGAVTTPPSLTWSAITLPGAVEWKPVDD